MEHDSTESFTPEWSSILSTISSHLTADGLTCNCRERGPVGGSAAVVRDGDVRHCPAADAAAAAAEFHVISAVTSSTARHRPRCRLLPCRCRC